MDVNIYLYCIIILLYYLFEEFVFGGGVLSRSIIFIVFCAMLIANAKVIAQEQPKINKWRDTSSNYLIGDSNWSTSIGNSEAAQDALGDDGLQVSRAENRGLKVDGIKFNSPSYNAGIKIGDIILKVNDKDLTLLDDEKIASFLNFKKDEIVKIEYFSASEGVNKTIDLTMGDYVSFDNLAPRMVRHSLNAALNYVSNEEIQKNWGIVSDLYGCSASLDTKNEFAISKFKNAVLDAFSKRTPELKASSRIYIPFIVRLGKYDFNSNMFAISSISGFSGIYLGGIHTPPTGNMLLLGDFNSLDNDGTRFSRPLSERTYFDSIVTPINTIILGAPFFNQDSNAEDEIKSSNCSRAIRTESFFSRDPVELSNKIVVHLRYNKNIADDLLNGRQVGGLSGYLLEGSVVGDDSHSKGALPILPKIEPSSAEKIIDALNKDRELYFVIEAQIVNGVSDEKQANENKYHNWGEGTNLTPIVTAVPLRTYVLAPNLEQIGELPIYWGAYLKQDDNLSRP